MIACKECADKSEHVAEIRQTADGRDIPIEARLATAITPDHLAQAKAWEIVLRSHRTPDATWDWAQWVAETIGSDPSRFEGCALLVGQELQGLSILDRGSRLARDGSSAKLAYLEYLAVAPANRRSIQVPTRYRHCGKMLLYFGRHRSANLGLLGRLGLHSLSDPETEAFYRSRGMQDFGLDPLENNLRYFEFGPEEI